MAFMLGQLIATRGVADLMDENADFKAFVWGCLARFKGQDWGDMVQSDKARNDAALITGDDRIFAAYNNADHPAWRLWIITEYDHSATTILFPDEY